MKTIATVVLLIATSAAQAQPVEVKKPIEVEVRVISPHLRQSMERAKVEEQRRLTPYILQRNAKIRAERQQASLEKLGALNVAEMKEWRKLDGDESKALMAFQRNGKAEDRDKALKALLRKVELLTKEETAAK